MSFLSSILGTIGNVASTVGQGVGSAATKVGEGIGSVFSSGKDAMTQTSDPNAWRNVSYEAPPANVSGGQSGWGAIAQEAGKSVFKNIKSSDMPPGTKGLATKKSGKYTPGVVGPDAPQGLRAVKGMEQEEFRLNDKDLERLQKGLDDRARNRAAMAGYNAEKGKYSDLMPTEGSPYETPTEASYKTDEDWDKWLDNYYTNGYDQWSFND